jgi:hypothetical protein
VPGIGTIHGFCASSHASAICAGVAFLLITDGGKTFADQLFVDKRTVGFGGVEESDATVHSGPKEGDHFLPIFRRAIVHAHVHAAKPKG